MSADLEALLSRWRTLALRAAAVGAALCLIGLLVHGGQLLESYLLAFVFWSGVALGCLAWALLHRLTAGQWGKSTRRLFESTALAIVPMAVLFLPILFGMSRLYPWARPDEVAADHHLHHKAPYLNAGFFVIRAVICFAIWGVYAWLANRDSEREYHGRTGPSKFRHWCGVGLALYVATVTFASVDWVMSLEPHWFSMIYGLLFVVGQGLAALAFVTLLLVGLARTKPLEDSVDEGQYHDLGTLMFAFVMLFAYIAFSQFLIIWYGNLNEDIPWYIKRSSAGWQVLAFLVILAHFFVPFVILLNKSVKRNARRLAYVAGLLLVMRFIDQLWTVMPAFRPEGPFVHWLDIATTLMVGGLFVAFVTWRLGRTPLVIAVAEEAAPGDAAAGEVPAHG